MAGTIKLEIVTPERVVVSEEAQIVTAPGTLGEFGVLIGHTPFLTALQTGAVRYLDPQGGEHFVFVSGGFAEALPDRVTVLAESAERRRDIDVERARAARETASQPGPGRGRRIPAPSLFSPTPPGYAPCEVRLSLPRLLRPSAASTRYNTPEGRPAAPPLPPFTTTHTSVPTLPNRLGV